MNPQTAAALIRALVERFRSEPSNSADMKRAFKWCADELAAVLTQDGAAPDEDVCDWHGQRQPQHSWVDCDGGGRRCIHCKREEHAAPAEPRAAEGAGMDGVVRPLGSPSDYSYGSLEDGLNLAAELNGTKPTAAAAVPAGGGVTEAWQLVPVKPTQAMLDAGYWPCVQGRGAKSVWGEMLRASTATPLAHRDRLREAAPQMLKALKKFSAHYPRGLNPFLDEAANMARVIIRSIAG